MDYFFRKKIQRKYT